MPYIDESDEEAVADELKERRKMISGQIAVCEDGWVKLSDDDGHLLFMTTRDTLIKAKRNKIRRASSLV